MKTTFFAVTIGISLTLLVSATVWEGVSAVVSSGDLPGNYSVATNAFPRNSVVDILNLENGKMVRAVVTAGLETNSLLARLSRAAADAIDARGATCRIRMAQPPADVAFAHSRLGPIDILPPVVAETESLPKEAESYGVSENVSYGVLEDVTEYVSEEEQPSIAQTEPQLEAASAVVYVDEPIVEPIAAETVTDDKPPMYIISGADNADTNETYIPLAEVESEPQSYLAAAVMSNRADDPITVEASVEAFGEEPIEETPVYAAVNTAAEAALPVMENPLLEGDNTGSLSMIPAEERLPVPIAAEIAPIAAVRETARFSPFQAPLIDYLEQGKWYVQVAVYARPDHVEDEISRIGPGYPLAIQNIGNDANPKFRVLLGPYNQGESGAMLQRFKSIGYVDAFLRNN